MVTSIIWLWTEVVDLRGEHDKTNLGSRLSGGLLVYAEEPLGAGRGVSDHRNWPTFLIGLDGWMIVSSGRRNALRSVACGAGTPPASESLILEPRAGTDAMSRGQEQA